MNTLRVSGPSALLSLALSVGVAACGDGDVTPCVGEGCPNGAVDDCERVAEPLIDPGCEPLWFSEVDGLAVADPGCSTWGPWDALPSVLRHPVTFQSLSADVPSSTAGCVGPAVCDTAHPCVAPYAQWAEGLALQAPLSWWNDLYPAVVDPEGQRTCPPDHAALRDGLVAALGMGGALGTLEQQEVIAAVGPWEAQEERQEAVIQLTHPSLGTWSGVMWVGSALEPGPGILMLHGHGQDGPAMLSSQGGQGLVDAGFTVLAMTHRAMAGFYRETFDGEREACEYWTALHLLETTGAPLLGPLLLEDLAALSVLGALDHVDPDRLAVMGHSGGAHRARALATLDPHLSALVVDYPFHSAYLGTCEEVDSPTCDLPHCETVPDARPFGRLLNLAASLPTPILELPYEDALNDDRASVVAGFLTEALAP